MRRQLTYVLDGQTPVVESDPIQWADWFETADRHVADTTLANGIRISTVFLGLDHCFSRVGPPVLFETMVFSKNGEVDVDRYTTWEEADRGHTAMVMKYTQEE